MDVKSGRVGATGGAGLLLRSLAAILLAFAAVIGLPTAVGGPVAMLGGDWKALAFVAGCAAVSGMLAWLGSLLWTGRPIPGWFIAGFFASIYLLPSAVFLAEGRWIEAIALLGLAFAGLCLPRPLGLLRGPGPNKLTGGVDDLA